MARVKGGSKTRQRRKKIINAAEGFFGRRKNTIRKSSEAVRRALVNAYRDRKAKKRDFRSLWIQRINAATRDLGSSYSVFTCGLKKNTVELDRKILADLAAHDKAGFEAVFQKATN